jgi:hypothetical protein
LEVGSLRKKLAFAMSFIFDIKLIKLLIRVHYRGHLFLI